jgi:hypothetical protein
MTTATMIAITTTMITTVTTTIIIDPYQANINEIFENGNGNDFGRINVKCCTGAGALSSSWLKRHDHVRHYRR